MLESAISWFVSVMALFGVSLIASVPPEPTIIPEQPPVEAIQTPPVPTEIPQEAKSAETLPPVTKPKEVDPYCAQYASRYSEAKYKDKLKEPKGAKNECEEDKKERKGSVKSLEYNCDAVKKEAEKEFEEWKREYNAYKSRCS